MTSILSSPINFTHLKLWIASARHNFKWVKFKLNNLAVKGLNRIARLSTNYKCVVAVNHGVTASPIQINVAMTIQSAITITIMDVCHSITISGSSVPQGAVRHFVRSPASVISMTFLQFAVVTYEYIHILEY